ncbi:hypothetical protein SEA_ERICMILLARD_171 [Mycobacterium phage EricMillard]|nr:hypothetical protein SEA_ERICMILLARD_171 [Mycobacterium phage EricMillard]
MKRCAACDNSLEADEPRVMVNGEALHPWCDLTPTSKYCADDRCHWWRTDHAGECVA